MSSKQAYQASIELMPVTLGAQHHEDEDGAKTYIPMRPEIRIPRLPFLSSWGLTRRFMSVSSVP